MGKNHAKGNFIMTQDEAYLQEEKRRYIEIYLDKGFSIIPIKGPVYAKGDTEKELANDSKEPLTSWAEYQSRQPTEDEIKKWWTKWPKANIGIVTGRVSGITVVDLDGKDAVEFARKNNFPATPLVKTGRDFGFHEYYRYREGIRNFQKRDDLPGIDLRGDGGYVIAPPSIHWSGKRYKWINGKGLDNIPLAEIPEIIFIKNSRDNFKRTL
jgi:hypothetical protein